MIEGSKMGEGNLGDAALIEIGALDRNILIYCRISHEGNTGRKKMKWKKCLLLRIEDDYTSELSFFRH